MAISEQEMKRRLKALRSSHFFAMCTDAELRGLALDMKEEIYKDGDVLIEEGEPTRKMFMIVEGQVEREKEIDNQVHKVDLLHTHSQGTFGALHLLRQDPAYARAVCVSPRLVAYSLEAFQVESHLKRNPALALGVIHSLSMEVRHRTRTLRTPLFEQTQKPFTWGAITAAASVESFYRSALNSVLNWRLTGHRGALFPNMHVQLPTRVLYINGFKGIRHYLDMHVHPEHHGSLPAVRFGAAIAPGVIMTPVSSILEACNAGHVNPESLRVRWTRGLVPRTVREVIFGIGLNQLSDYCEERVPWKLTKNETLRNMLGSMSAGVISGYLSHVPHNLSTLKLMQPNKTYGELFKGLVDMSLSRVPASLPASLRHPVAVGMAVLLPRGMAIRTTQLVGSFVILNTTIETLKGKDPSDLFRRPSVFLTTRAAATA